MTSSAAFIRCAPRMHFCMQPASATRRASQRGGINRSSQRRALLLNLHSDTECEGGGKAVSPPLCQHACHCQLARSLVAGCCHCLWVCAFEHVSWVVCFVAPYCDARCSHPAAQCDGCSLMDLQRAEEAGAGQVQPDRCNKKGAAAVDA